MAEYQYRYRTKESVDEDKGWKDLNEAHLNHGLQDSLNEIGVCSIIFTFKDNKAIEYRRKPT